MFGKIMFLFKVAEAQVLGKQYPFSLIKFDILFKLFAKNLESARCVHIVKIINPKLNIRNPKSNYLIHNLSSKKNTANTTLAIPLVVIKAKFTRLRSLGFTSRC